MFFYGNVRRVGRIWGILLEVSVFFSIDASGGMLVLYGTWDVWGVEHFSFNSVIVRGLGR